jgi:hypothetical protein
MKHAWKRLFVWGGKGAIRTLILVALCGFVSALVLSWITGEPYLTKLQDVFQSQTNAISLILMGVDVALFGAGAGAAVYSYKKLRTDDLSTTGKSLLVAGGVTGLTALGIYLGWFTVGEILSILEFLI